MTQSLQALVAAREHELRALRRRLHTHPELSWQETATTQMLVERLRVAGLDPVVLNRGTGLVCDIGDTQAGSIVAIRADIDALAMADLTETEYRSRVPGVAHACGHDVHTAVVLGVGLALRALAEQGGEVPPVRLIFEPAEESMPGGALDVIEEGWLEGVAMVFGLHCDPRLDIGQIGVRSGAITAASDIMEIEIAGPGGHTARPHLTVDLTAVMGRVLTELPTAIVAAADSPEQVTVVFGAAHAGDAPNVIPARASLRGSVRTADIETWDRIEKVVESELATILAGTGATWQLAYRRGVPPVVNDPDATRVLHSAAVEVVGSAGVVENPRSMGGDTFAWYAQRVPASYARLGTHFGDGPRLDLHASTFDIDERAIAIGMEFLARAVVNYGSRDR